MIGSGFAGLAAAYEAKKAGGNSIINGGIMAVPGSELQKEKGIKDSPEMMAEDMLIAGLYQPRRKAPSFKTGLYGAARKCKSSGAVLILNVFF